MRNPWHYIQVKTILNTLDNLVNIVDDLIELQEEKIQNYPVNLQGSPNFSLSESRLETLTEFKSNLEEALNTINNLD